MSSPSQSLAGSHQPGFQRRSSFAEDTVSPQTNLSAKNLMKLGDRFRANKCLVLTEMQTFLMSPKAENAEAQQIRKFAKWLTLDSNWRKFDVNRDGSLQMHELERAVHTFTHGTSPKGGSEMPPSTEIYTHQHKISRPRVTGGTAGGSNVGNSSWAISRRFKSFIPSAAHQFEKDRSSLSGTQSFVFSGSQRFEDIKNRAPSPGQYQRDTSQEDWAQGLQSYQFSKTARDMSLNPIPESERGWRGKLGPGSYEHKLPNLSTKVKMSMTPRPPVPSNLGEHMGPGRYHVTYRAVDTTSHSFSLPASDLSQISPQAPINQLTGDDSPMHRNLRTTLVATTPRQRNMTRAVTARTKAEHRAHVQENHKKNLHAAKLRKQTDACRWIKVHQEREEANQRRDKVRVVLQKWSIPVTMGARMEAWVRIMLDRRVERMQAQKEFTCARMIQRRVRMFLGLRRLIHENRVMLLVRAIEKTLMRFFISRRCLRRKRAVSMLFRYCAEIAEAEGMRTVCQRFRVSVIKAQRVVRNFLAIRSTQVDLMERYWEIKECKLNSIAQEKAAEKSKQPKSPKNDKIVPVLYNEVPYEIRREVILADMRSRRKQFDETKAQREVSAEMNAARDLISGKTVRQDVASGKKSFRVIPSEEAMFTLIRKGQAMMSQAVESQ